MPSKPTDAQLFTIHHQDGDLVYEVEHARFNLSDGLLSLSVDAQRDDPGQFALLLSLLEVEIDGEPTVGQTWSVRDFGNESAPYARVYFGFHAQEIEFEATIVAINQERMVVCFCVITEDMDYYDERAKRNAITGRATLERSHLADIWIP